MGKREGYTCVKLDFHDNRRWMQDMDKLSQRRTSESEDGYRALLGN